MTLDEYRVRYASYKLDPDLQAAHAAAPWVVKLDDHEVVDNWADEAHPSAPPAQFLVRRANAFRAYWEHMPLRFAQLVGLVFAVLGLIGYLTGVTVLGVVATGFALVAAFVNAAVGLCLGCEASLLIHRIRTPTTATN